MKRYIFLQIVLLPLTFISPQEGWVLQNSGTTADLRDVVFVDSQTGVAVGALGTILLTSNGGSTWIQVPSGTNKNLHGVEISGQIIIAVGESATIVRSMDMGASWATLLSPTTNHLYDISLKGNLGFICGDYSILQTTDTGLTWSHVNYYSSGIFRSINLIDSNYAYLSGGSDIQLFLGSLNRTIDGGNTWLHRPIGAHATSFYDTCNGLIFRHKYRPVDYDRIGRTTDGGLTITLFPNEDGYFRDLQYIDMDNFVFVGGTFHATKGKIIISRDQGLTWSTYYHTEPSNFYGVYFIDKYIGTVVGSSGLILRTTTGGISAVNDIHYKPDEFVLYHNFPNPFNTSTIISYSIAEYSDVNIKIFDVLGNEIETLIDEGKSAGKYEIVWNADKHSGGVYFYQFKAGSYIETKMMIFLK